MTEPVASTSKLGRKPKWYFADDELSRLISRMSMDSAAELKYRREAAEFIQEMAERLNHNILNTEDNWQSCIRFNKTTMMFAFIWLVDVQIMKCERSEPN